nr:SG reporter [Vector pO2RL]
MASKSNKQVTVEVSNNGRNRSKSRARSQSRGRDKSVKITVNSRNRARRQPGRDKRQSSQRVRNIVNKQLRKQGVTGPKPAICQRATATLGTVGSNTSGTTEIEACILLNPVLVKDATGSTQFGPVQALGEARHKQKIVAPVKQTLNFDLLKLAGDVESNPGPASKVYDPEQRKRMITGPQWWARCKQMNVLDSFINYYDSEKHAENAVIFLHGNAASSYLWRHVVPHIEPVARCIIPDLIGMGKSGKSGNGSYRLLDHYKYLTAWFELLNLPKKIIFVGHDWGACLAFHYSYEHQDKIKAIVHAESVVDVIESWDEWPDIEEDIALIKSEEGEKMVLENNFFVETMLPSKIMRKLEPEEFAAYLEPFKEKGEVRRPTLSWPREIPLVKGGKPDVVQIVRNYNAYLRASDDLPKMFIESDPGFFSNAIVEGAKKFPNTEFVKVKGLHFSQEDAPDEMGKYIKSFVERVLKNEQ